MLPKALRPSSHLAYAVLLRKTSRRPTTTERSAAKGIDKLRRYFASIVLTRDVVGEPQSAKDEGQAFSPRGASSDAPRERSQLSTGVYASPSCG